jgi:hypothetical protein
MLNALTREIRLAIQAKSGTSAAVLVWMGVLVFALLTAFVFLCVAGYDWLALRYDGVIAGLIMAGIFLGLAIVAAIIGALLRRRVRERAILARAARAHAPSWLLDPRILNTAIAAGRSFGWQRMIPVALLGFMVAQWARENRDRDEKHF